MATLHDHMPWLPTVATIKGRVCKANLSSAFPPFCQKANWFCNLKMQRTGNVINFMKTCSVMKSLLPMEAPSQHINLGLSHSMTKTISPAIFSVSLASYAHRILEEFHLDLSSWLLFRDKYNFLCLIGDRGSGRGSDSPKVHSKAGAGERVQLQAPPASDLTAHLVKPEKSLGSKTEVLSPNEAAGISSAHSMPAPPLALDLHHRIQHPQQRSDRASDEETRVRESP